MAQLEPSRHNHQVHIKADGHFTESVVYVTIDTGQLMLLVCDRCKLIETHCLHVNNSWNKEGTQLTCDFCGLDGT